MATVSELTSKNIASAQANVQTWGNIAVNVKVYGAKGDGVTDDTTAIKAALAAGNNIIVPAGIYRMTDRLITNGHTIRGEYTSETFYSSSPSIIRFDSMPAVESCVMNEGQSSNYEGILFEHAAWDGTTTEIHGLTLRRGITAKNCGWNAFPGQGILLYADTVNAYVPYHSVFDHCTTDYNKKHNVVIGNGANAVTFRNHFSRWAGAPSYKTAPSVIDVYDGIYIDGQMAGLPTGLVFEPQGVFIEGGDIAYNSRYGTNMDYCNDNTILGGYYEANLALKDINIDNSYGCQIVNPMCAQGINVTTIDQDPITPSRNIYTYPNNIVVRGKFLGNGILNAYNQNEALFRSMLTPNGTFISPATDDKDIVVDRRFGTSSQAFFTFTDKVRLRPKWLTVGDPASTDTAANVLYSPSGATEGNIIMYLSNFATLFGGATTSFRVATGSGANVAATALNITRNSVTSRSINAAGTLNASGADYAEYMRKNTSCGEIAKGQICGIDENGELTDQWAQTKSFVVKSTNPSYVGGDTWGDIGEQPQVPVIEEDESEEVFKERYASYESELAEWEARLEAERIKVDRIAFAGQVPVNVYGANAGDYIVPVQDSDGIKGEVVSNPTFEQYQQAVGKVITNEVDGRARVIVKVI